MLGLPSLDQLGDAAANAFDSVFTGGLADLRPTPPTIIDDGPKRTAHPPLPRGRSPPVGAPVLLVPPLAAPYRCFDLHRDCSLAQDLMERHFRTYVVEYGDIAFSDR